MKESLGLSRRKQPASRPGGQPSPALVHLLAVHAHRLGRSDPDADSVSLDRRNRDPNIEIDHDLLADSSREY
jgi:hypothetical protein